MVKPKKQQIELRIDEYKPVAEDAPLPEQVDFAIAHLTGFPCPGCKSAATLLQLLRPFAEEIDGSDKAAAEEPPFM